MKKTINVLVAEPCEELDYASFLRDEIRLFPLNYYGALEKFAASHDFDPGLPAVILENGGQSGTYIDERGSVLGRGFSNVWSNTTRIVTDYVQELMKTHDALTIIDVTGNPMLQLIYRKLKLIESGDKSMYAIKITDTTPNRGLSEKETMPKMKQ